MFMYLQIYDEYAYVYNDFYLNQYNMCLPACIACNMY